MTVDDNLMKIMYETATTYLYHPDDNKPTEITRYDIDKTFEKMFSSTLLGRPSPRLTHAIDINKGASGINIDNGGKTLRFRRYEPFSLFSRQQQRVQLPSGSPGFTDNLI